MKPILPIWLWAEADGVRLWTPATTAHYAGVQVNATAEHWRRLTRDGTAQIGLEAVLAPAALVRDLAKVRSTEQGRPVLYLADDVAALQALPFEFLWLDGQPLAAWGLTVARWVARSNVPAAPVPPGPIYIADLWPRTAGEPHVLAGLREVDACLTETVHILCGAAASRAAILHLAPSQYAALVVFGHGHETDGAPAPLLQPDGTPWQLPLEHGVPPLVVLLACGSENGNLIDYGRDLLQAGARAVLAPFGRLDQPQARRFLELFLPLWLQSTRLDLALHRARDQDASGWGARRLVLLGDPGLRCATEPLLAERSDQALATLSQTASEDAPAALALLAQRLTLQCFQQGQGLSKARQHLLEQLGLQRGAATAERALLRQLEAVYAQGTVGALTHLWLVPWLAQLAEQHDHRRLTFYEQQRESLRPVADLAPALVYHDWNRVAYRRGRYAQALEEVLRGLHALSPSQLWPEGAPLVRDLANLFIEFNLPQAARTVARHLDAHLGALPPTTEIATERFKLADTLARACLRGGDWQAALGLLRRKREVTTNSGNPDSRELAWLLYSGAWGKPQATETQVFAQQVADRLQDQTAVRTALAHEQGNSDGLYLLRAYAAWAWRATSATAAHIVLHYRDVLDNDLHRRQDSGPIGFVIGYLHLHDAPDAADWGAARELLRQDRYFLEAAAFDALLGQRQAADDSLALFQAQRAAFPATLERLAQAHLALDALSLDSTALSNWAEEANERAALEQEWLVRRIPTAADLLRFGLLPM